MWYWILIAVCSIPLYIVNGWLIFDNWGNFTESIRFWFTRDYISLLRGNWHEDTWAEFKVGIWIGMCVVAVFFVDWVLQAYLL